jgi:hypothetical protein
MNTPNDDTNDALKLRVYEKNMREIRAAVTATGGDELCSIPRHIRDQAHKIDLLTLQRDGYRQQLTYECETRDKRIADRDAELARVRRVYEAIGDALNPGAGISAVNPETALEDMTEVRYALDQSRKTIEKLQAVARAAQEEIDEKHGCLCVCHLCDAMRTAFPERPPRPTAEAT